MDNDNTTPQETAPAAAAEVAEDVTHAASSATEVARQTSDEGWKVVAEELKGLRADINTLMKKPEAAPVTAVENAAEPVVEVEKPAPVERKVRRGHRKVKRNG